MSATMLVQAHTFNPSSNNAFLSRRRQNPRLHGSLCGSSKIWLLRRKGCGVSVSASSAQSSSYYVEKKRKVVEHISLIKAKSDLSEEDEKNMLDYLYTTQYQMGGILSISLGRIANQNDDAFTHAVFMRFQRKEELEKFYAKPFYLKVLEEHVLPHCHGLLDLDYESEVEDDILPIFRKGEEFNFGVELMILILFVDDANERVDGAFNSLKVLVAGFPSLIVQSTQGQNFNLRAKEYSHAVVIRFRSFEAFQIFEASSEYKNMWKTKFEPITQRTVSVHFSVDPVGTELM